LTGCWYVELSDSASQANTVEMVNTPMFVDDMMYTPYDQRSVDDVDDYKPPYNVRTRTYTRTRTPANCNPPFMLSPLDIF